jgi:hypothetical protein
MNIPRYWAKSTQSVTSPDGRRLALACWQWSDVSTDHAQQQAAARVGDVARRVLAGEQLNRYSYGERPLREEISQVVTNRAGAEIGVVTRNVYGALVLNAARAMFIDIDFADGGGQRSGGSSLRRLFGGATASPEQEHLQHLQTWWEQHRDLSIRVYRTYAGLRCLVVNQLFDPSQADAVEMLRALKSDPLYVRLCKAQGCFRARLTPKPWRCDVDRPPARYPWSDAASETRYRQWEQRYDRVAAQYATCRLLKQLGTDQPHPDVAPILDLHDRLACSERNLNLA